MYLVAFGLVILLPITALASTLFISEERSESARISERLVDTADGLARDIDLSVDQKFTILRTLATLPSLSQQNWSEFYEEAKAALQGDGYVIVLDPKLHELVNTYVPYGEAPTVTADPETARRTVETRMPAVSDLFVSRATEGPVYEVNIPIFDKSGLRYILILGQKAQDLQTILRAQTVNPEWVRAIVDRKGAILARTGGDDGQVGAQSKQLRDVPHLPTSTLQRAVSLEGIPVYRVVAYSVFSGWFAVVNVPVSVVDAPLGRLLRLWGAISFGAFVVTIGLAYWFGRMLSRPISGMAQTAKSLATGQQIMFTGSSLTEANVVLSAMEHASRELREREHHQALLLQEVNHRAKNLLSVVQAVVSRSLSKTRSMVENRDLVQRRIQTLARAQDHLVRTEWRGAPLDELIRTELEPFSDRFALTGPPTTILADKVQTLTMVLYELATNAAKYGPWSGPEGTVSITWSITGVSPKRVFKFRWQESGGPPVSQPKRDGFGMSLLKRSFTDATLASRFTFEPTGFVYEFEIAASGIAHVEHPTSH
jgi:two-component sensor histidine kinase